MSVNRSANDPVWGRSFPDNATGDRPPVDRSSGLYSSRRPAMSRESVSNPATNNSSCKAATPAAAVAAAAAAAATVAVKATTPETTASVSDVEEMLRSDLYLSSDEDDGAADGHPGGKETKDRAHGARPAAATEEPAKVVKDLNYWYLRATNMKTPSASNSEVAGSPDKSRGEVEVKKEGDEAVTPKSTYRELVKNALDSLGGQRPMRMLSGLPESDDEAPVVAEKPAKRAKQQQQHQNEHSGFRRRTPLSPVSHTFSEWKQGRKSRSPGPRPHPKSRVKGFVDRKIWRSPQRELVSYNDLDNVPDSSLSPDPVKEEPKFSASLVPSKRRKCETVETMKPQAAVKLYGSPSRRPRRVVKTEPKWEAVTEIGTQCEQMSTAERDIAESIAHTKRMAVRFRTAGGRGRTPSVSAESRNQPQTPRSSGPSGGLMMQGSGEVITGPAGVPRRRSSDSVDDGDAAQSNAGPEAASDSHDSPSRADPNEVLMDAVCRHRHQQREKIENANIA